MRERGFSYKGRFAVRGLSDRQIEARPDLGRDIDRIVRLDLGQLAVVDLHERGLGQLVAEDDLTRDVEFGEVALAGLYCYFTIPVFFICSIRPAGWDE